MELTFDQKRKYVEVRHPGQKIPAREKVSVCCAFHDEKNPSCTLFLDGNGGFNCNACGAKGNLVQFEMRFSNCDIETARKNIAQITGARLNDSGGRLVSAHVYRCREGISVSKKLRYALPDGGKRLVWYHRDSAGKWQKGLASDTPRLLYNQPEIVCANLILWAEGEKCCDALNELIPKLFPERQKNGLRIAVTTNPEGAWEPGSKPKWHAEYNKSFSDKDVVIFEDNDLCGRTLGDHVSGQIYSCAASVRRIAFPDQREKYDIADWVEEHSSDPERMIADLERIIEAAALWEPQSSGENWVVDAVEWASTASPETDYLIDGVIQADANGIIAAEPKTGKSLCALDMCISLACGVPWLGREVPRRIRVAYISREDSPVLTKARIAGFLRGKGADFEAIGRVIDPSGWLWCNTREQLGNFDVDNDEQLSKMAHDLKERGVEFTVLDVLNRIHSRAENDNSEMAQVVKRISQMGQDAGCNIGLVHHVSKENGSGGRFFTRIRGASAIHGWTEWSIGLTLENPNSDGLKLIRKAEFETKAAESCAPIFFTVEFGGGNLRLKVASFPTAYDLAREKYSRYQ